jgi:hypothetical protein
MALPQEEQDIRNLLKALNETTAQLLDAGMAVPQGSDPDPVKAKVLPLRCITKPRFGLHMPYFRLQAP